MSFAAAFIFAKGALFYLLRNRCYIGEVNYKGQIYPGEQPAIMDRKLFDAIQQRLADQWTHHTRTRSKFSFLLTGLIHDDAGQRMARTQAKKNGLNYRYYVSRPLLFGDAATARVGSVPRVPAAEIEGLVSKTILEPQLRGNQSSTLDNEFARSKIERIEIQSDQVLVWEKQESIVGDETEDASPILIQWKNPPSKKPREVLLPKNAPVKTRPMKLERRATLVAAIARGRRWLDKIVAGRATCIEEIATQNRCSARHVSMTISLAFLSPVLVKAAVEGRLSRGIGVEQLRELPPSWDDQFRALGLSAE